MKFFFGAAIQGHRTWGSHAKVYDKIIQLIKNSGHTVLTEHTTGLTRSETIHKLEQKIGPLPDDEYQSRVYVRNKMIEMLELDDLSGIVFEVSVPSLGTGVEIAHAYLRKQLGLKPASILVLYKKGFWPNKLSTMVKGIPLDQFPNFILHEYDDLKDLEHAVLSFVQICKKLEFKTISSC